MTYRERKRRGGYTDLGPIRIPPLPQFIVMEDRENGSFWTLSHTADGTDIELVPGIPRLERNIYDPYSGPYLADNVRIFVSSGDLFAEFAQGEGPNSNQRVLTRRGNSRNFLELSWDGTDDPGITLTPVSV